MRAAGIAMLWQSLQMGGVKVIYMVRLLVLAILLTPADFGLIAIATSAIGFLMNLTNFGMIPALVQAEELDQATVQTAWTFDTTRSILISGLTILFAPLIASNLCCAACGSAQTGTRFAPSTRDDDQH
jgi:O-antigen/teichoic acid export membrane protein